MAAKHDDVMFAMADQPVEPSAYASASNTASAVETSTSRPPSSRGTWIQKSPASLSASTTAAVVVVASSAASASALMSGASSRARATTASSNVIVTTDLRSRDRRCSQPGPERVDSVAAEVGDGGCPAAD